MTATFDTMFATEGPSGWNVFFAEEPDKDLDFDEGFEEDELHESKPPSRRPLLWILLLVLVSAIAYWILNDQSQRSPRTAAIEIESVEGTTSTQQEDALSDLPSPLFGENQTVVLVEGTGKTMLMGDATNSRPGPLVEAGERLTVLDGSHQVSGWVYQVQTESGKTGWISGQKIKSQS